MSCLRKRPPVDPSLIVEGQLDLGHVQLESAALDPAFVQDQGEFAHRQQQGEDLGATSVR